MKAETVFRHGLPGDPEAERWVLGLALRRPEANHAPIAAILSEADFSVDANRHIWRAIDDLAASGAHVDVGTVGRELLRTGALTSIGGASYLAELSSGMPDLPNVEAYARIVRDCSVRRQAALEMFAAAERLCEPGGDVGQIERAQSVLQNIGAKAVTTGGLRTVREIVDADGFLDPHRTEPGIGSPWPGLDRLTGGFRPGQLVILAARPAVGKSTMAVQLAVHAAEHGIGAAMYSLEMPGPLILRRLIAGRAGVDLATWNQGRLDAEERGAIGRESKAVAALPFWLYDVANATIASIRAELLRARASNEIGLVIVDYLQLIGSMRGRSSATRNDEVSEISRGLKVLAMELAVPVIALSQLSRAGERDNRAPRLSDLRDSGSIEQDADIVGFLHRAEEPSAGDSVDLRLAKNRAGAVGKVPLVFDARRARFRQTEGRL